MLFRGKKGQNAAMEECKTLNAKLPLPKNKGEADEFRKFTGPNETWIGIRDFTKSGLMSKWQDVEGNPIDGVNSFVNSGVINFTGDDREFSVLTPFWDGRSRKLAVLI